MGTCATLNRTAGMLVSAAFDASDELSMIVSGNIVTTLGTGASLWVSSPTSIAGSVDVACTRVFIDPVWRVIKPTKRYLGSNTSMKALQPSGRILSIAWIVPSYNVGMSTSSSGGIPLFWRGISGTFTPAVSEWDPVNCAKLGSNASMWICINASNVVLTLTNGNGTSPNDQIVSFPRPVAGSIGIIVLRYVTYASGNPYDILVRGYSNGADQNPTARSRVGNSAGAKYSNSTSGNNLGRYNETNYTSTVQGQDVHYLEVRLSTATTQNLDQEYTYMKNKWIVHP